MISFLKEAHLIKFKSISSGNSEGEIGKLESKFVKFQVLIVAKTNKSAPKFELSSSKNGISLNYQTLEENFAIYKFRKNADFVLFDIALKKKNLDKFFDVSYSYGKKLKYFDKI
jgi:hypothetical protein